MTENNQYITQDKLKAMQKELFKSTAIYLAKHSKYYEKIFKEINFNPFAISSIDDLHRLPIITKKDLLIYNKDIVCSSLSKVAELVSTSGSTGVNPIVHPLTRCDLRRLAYNEQMSFSIANMNEADYVMISTALDGSFVAGMAYYLGVKRIGAAVVRKRAKNWGMQLELLKSGKITTIVGVPSNLIKLSYYCAEHSFDVRKCNIKRLILIGESIRNGDFSLNQLGMRLLNWYPNAELHSTYANTETCTSFCECEFGNGGHLLHNLAYIEIVDQNGESLKEGEIGRLIITTFAAQGMPLLRYDTGDITFVINERCACGRTSMRIGPIISRANNIVKVDGVTFSQAQIENAILSVAQINDYCIVVDQEDGISRVKIWYSVCLEANDFDENILRDVIWNTVRVNPKLERCTLDLLEKIQNGNLSRKSLRFINKSL